MLQTFLATLSPMLVLFCCIVIGFLLKRLKILPSNAGAVMSKLETYVFVPALTISTFMNYCTVESLATYSNLILYSIISVLLAMGIAIPLSCLFVKERSYKRNIYKYALTFANCGFMGNAIVPAVLGAADGAILYKYLLFTLPLSLVIYSWGIYILVPRGEGHGGVWKNLLNPTIIAMAIGIALGLSGIGQHLPDFVVTLIDNCKVCMGPVAMILTGFIIGGFPFMDLLNDKKVYIATGLRLVVIPAVILGALKLIGASDLALTLALFAYATPLGMNTVVFPAAYGGDTKTGASMAAISHTLCVVTIPVMYALLTLLLK